VLTIFCYLSAELEPSIRQSIRLRIVVMFKGRLCVWLMEETGKPYDISLSMCLDILIVRCAYDISLSKITELSLYIYYSTNIYIVV
jgi:hypothetical protein